MIHFPACQVLIEKYDTLNIGKMENWTCVYTTNQVYKAEAVKNLLAEENIEAVVVDKKDSASLVFGEVELYVQPEDENMAVELIKGFRIE